MSNERRKQMNKDGTSRGIAPTLDTLPLSGEHTGWSTLIGKPHQQRTHFEGSFLLILNSKILTSRYTPWTKARTGCDAMTTFTRRGHLMLRPKPHREGSVLDGPNHLPLVCLQTTSDAATLALSEQLSPTPVIRRVHTGR